MHSLHSGQFRLLVCTRQLGGTSRRQRLERRLKCRRTLLAHCWSIVFDRVHLHVRARHMHRIDTTDKENWTLHLSLQPLSRNPIHKHHPTTFPQSTWRLVYCHPIFPTPMDSDEAYAPKRGTVIHLQFFIDLQSLLLPFPFQPHSASLELLADGVNNRPRLYTLHKIIFGHFCGALVPEEALAIRT